MSLAIQPLPADPEALRRFRRGSAGRTGAQGHRDRRHAAEIHAKTLHIEKLKMQLAVLRRARFGRSSEKLDREIEQLELLIGELEEERRRGARPAPAQPIPSRNDPADDQPAATANAAPVRAPLPAHLPRETVTHEPACTCPGCGGTCSAGSARTSARCSNTCPSSFKVIAPRPAEAELPRLRDDRAGADAVAADRARPAGARPDRPCAGLQILRPHRRCTARPASMRARASSSTAPRSPTGSARRCSCSPRWPRRSAAMSAPATCCMPTTPPCRCCRRAWARPRPGGSG